MPVPQEANRDLFYDSFPSHFKWGSTSSATSIEGAVNIDGRTMSWWDTTSRRDSQAIIDQSRPDHGADSYHKFKEDVQLLKEMNATCYKFSLSWSRILPDGTTGKINKAGVEYYDNLINTLLENGIEPIIVLYHWDFPHELFEKHPFNWMDPSVIKAFGNYAKFCFTKFQKVKRWIPIHDPWKHSECGFGSGIHPPNVSEWEKGTPVKVFRNLLKAHTLAYRIYDKQFRTKLQGQIGISVNSKCISSSERNCLKNEVAVPDFASCTELRPSFNPNAFADYGTHCWNEIKGTEHDFIDLTNEDIHSEISLSEMKSNKAVHQKRNSFSNLNNTRVVLNTIKKDLNNPEVLLCGKGYPLIGSEITNLVDLKRTQYFQAYANEILKALVLDGCNVVGFLPGTLVDSWEWENGYSLSYGLHQVKFDHPLKYRIQRLSAKYLTKLFKTHGFSKMWDIDTESHSQSVIVRN